MGHEDHIIKPNQRIIRSIWFRIKEIDACTGQVTTLNRVGKRLRFHDLASAEVKEYGSLLHPSNLIASDQTPCLLGQWDMNAENVGKGDKIVERAVLDAEFLLFDLRETISLLYMSLGPKARALSQLKTNATET